MKSRFAFVVFTVLSLPALVFHSATPSWCFVVITAYLAPLSLIKSTQFWAFHLLPVKRLACAM